jgi:hypothetical protein
MERIWPLRLALSGAAWRRMSCGWAALLIATALLAPVNPAIGATASSSQVKFYDGGFECYAGPLALHLPDTYRQLLALGKVERTHDLKTQVNRGSTTTSTTTQRALIFDGLTLTVDLFSSEPDRYLLAGAVITEPRWQISGLRVGEPAQLMLAAPGWPAPPADGTWEMQGDGSHVLVAIRHRLIATITYDCEMP